MKAKDKLKQRDSRVNKLDKMKAEKEIEAQLKAAKKELREVRARFEKYDNHDDMDLIPVVEQEIKTLEWVLGLNV